jgi:hypothetical protein
MAANKRVALCCFATGRYKEFLPDLARTAREHFDPGDTLDLVGFVDNDQTPAGFDRVFQIPHLRWPYGTLYRYRWLAEREKELSQYDYLFMCDVDMRFVGPVGPEILGGLVGVLHAGHLKKNPQALPYCRHKGSTARVRPGLGTRYYAGGFQGGAARQYLKACRHIADNITQDERHHYIADWHDESHWNAYLVSRPPAVSLSPQYCWGEPDGCPPGTKILALAKDHAAFRSDGADPASIAPVTAPPEPPAPVPATAPQSRQDVKELVRAVQRSNLRPDAQASLQGLLGQLDRVLDRAAPRVMHAGPQGDLAAVLRELLPRDPVVYVDVGASEPVDCSNTHPFYLAGGHGLLIEPRPSCWYAILLQRPRDRLYPKAVAAQEGWADMKLCDACSSLDQTWTNEKRGELLVQTEPLGTILHRFPEIRDACQLVSIDTEGTEEAVIGSVDWTTFRPQVAVVEHASFQRPEESEHRADAILGLMRERGYRVVHRDAINLVFKRIP